MVQCMLKYSPEAVFHTGDLVFNGRCPKQWKIFNGIVAPLVEKAPLYAVRGNHELGRMKICQKETLPNEQAWYSVNLHGIHYVVLDVTSPYKSGSRQYNWLVSDLSGQPENTDFTVVLLHYPVYTSSFHQTQLKELRENLVPVFEQYGVDVVFSAHNHGYERSFSNGIYYITTAGGGAPLYGMKQKDPHSQVFVQTNHFCTLNVRNDSLIVTALDTNFRRVDQFGVAAENRAQEGKAHPDERLQWFRDARLGIFIHWGIYAVNGIDESWSFYNGHISYEDYMKQLGGFTASKYDPAAWADLFAEAGAKYVVLTAKHHDGVALWPSECQGAITLQKDAPVSADLIGPYVRAMQAKNLKAGLYYSLIDWSYPDYPGFTRETSRYSKDSIRFQHFTDYNFCQIREISKRYRPDLVWFDGDWEHTANEWKAADIKKLLLEDNPAVVVNSRLSGYGDYGTPENGPPVYRPKDPVWELCLTTNTSWGYQPADTFYKSTGQILGILADCIAMGGNLLLDIGPREDGTLPEEQVQILKELGRWTRKHAEAVYGTLPGIPMECFHGPSCISKDSTMLYLFLQYRPTGPVVVKGLKTKIVSAEVLGTGVQIPFELTMKPSWSSYSGVNYITVPGHLLDPEVTVIKLRLAGPVRVDRP